MMSSSHFRAAKPVKEFMKVCPRCNEKKASEEFEGYKRCKPCRELRNSQYRRLMADYKRAGVGQRLRLTDEERDRLFTAFDSACVFCGNDDQNKLKLTRLIHARNGGGDDLYNTIICCSSCMNSRKGSTEWDQWYKARSDIYLQSRFERILAWHNQLPINKIRVPRSR